MAHPGGIGTGVASEKQAWVAAMQGTSFGAYAASHPELNQSIERFGYL